MSPQTARISVAVMAAISIPLTLYPLWALIEAHTKITQGIQHIYFYTGVFYFFLASIFWPMAAVELCGGATVDSKPTRACSWLREHAGLIFILWFCCCLAIGSTGHLFSPSYFESKGYTKCPNPNSVSGASRGKSYIFTLGHCKKSE